MEMGCDSVGNNVARIEKMFTVHSVDGNLTVGELQSLIDLVRSELEGDYSDGYIAGLAVHIIPTPAGTIAKVHEL